MKKNFGKAIYTLEFDKIREMLAEVAPTEGAAARALTLEPDTDIDRIRLELKKTTAAKKLIGEKGMPSFWGVYDPYSALDKVSKGAPMTAAELLRISSLLNCTAALKNYITEARDGFEAISVYFSRLEPDKALCRKITESIISEEMIADEASPELAAIRRKIRAVNNRIRDNLKKYTTDSSYTKYLQENIVTMRNGRYVIPVRAECKSEIKGLLHDMSSSGQTVFIEPIAIVEANNELHMLTIEEGKEIEKILYALSVMCLNISEKLSLNYYNITELAFIFAKGELSYKLMAEEPKVNSERYMELVKARHPLLDPKKVVPVNLRLGKDFDTLVITGPNTGGKTVTLKTIGLFSIMAQSGLHIPVSDGSSVCVFTSIFADIGDEQSIEQSLSTFSAHMKNIVGIVEEMDDGSLCLFDELGAGTDPTEGASLAISILEDVRRASALCAATTHYAELKIFALETAGVCNASCEFDVTTLAPTYKLVIGTPGKSNAFAISEKLGLPDHIVRAAKSRIASDERKFENVIEKLEGERVQMEKNRLESEKMRQEYETKYKKAESDIEKREKEAQKKLEKALQDAESIVASAKASAKYILDELNTVKKKQAQNEDVRLDETRRLVKREFEKMDEKLSRNSEKPAEEENYVLPRPLKKGDEVFIRSLGKNGFLDNDPDKSGNVSVNIGIFSTKVKVKDLKLVENEVTVVDKTGKKKRAAEYNPSPIRAFSTELDIRGSTGEDGWLQVDKFIDEAIMMRMTNLRIIHGKGTGQLRAYITRELKHDKRVKSFRLGDYGEGDSGVTVIELK